MTVVPFRRKGAAEQVAGEPAAPVKAGRSSRGGLRPLLASLLVLAAIYIGALVYLQPPSPGRELRLDEVITAASTGQVATARFLDEDARVVGTLKPVGDQTAGQTGGWFWTSYPRSDAATNYLLQSFFTDGVQVEVDAQSGKGLVRFLAQFLLPLVILANLFALLFALARPGGSGGGVSEYLSFGRLGNKQLTGKNRSATSFADIAANTEAVAELAEVRDYLADPTAFKAMGALPPKGVLIVGPPGCGKTLLARAVAGEANVPFFSISGSEFVESLVGVGAARVRDLFRQARASAPSILFIDELDGVGRRRGAGVGGGHDEREQTLNELLVQMDGFAASEGVVVLAATNRPDILDPALLRPGRFDRKVTVEGPDVAGRLAILSLHATSRRLADPQTDLAMIARRTAGFTGADLAGVINEAALLAVRAREPYVSGYHLEEAVERVVAGPRRAGRLLSAADKRRTAGHEAGHAVVAAAFGRADMLEKVSVIARGRSMGHLALSEPDKALLSREDMLGQIAIALAGFAAEEILFGGPSTGAEGDIERATSVARDMAGRYGMSLRLGPVRILREQGEVFLGRDYLSAGEVSQPTLESLDEEVRRTLEEQKDAAHAVLTAHRRVLDQLTSTLTTQETVQGAELTGILAEVRPYLKVAARRRQRAAPSA